MSSAQLFLNGMKSLLVLILESNVFLIPTAGIAQPGYGQHLIQPIDA